MEANRYQFLAQRTANHDLTKYDQLREAIYGLNGESGEAIDILKKHEFQGHTFDRDHLISELGDIAWYLASACSALSIGLDDLFERNIQKLEERYPNGFEADKSIHRKD